MPLKRIDVPYRVLRWDAMTLADLLDYEAGLERVIPLLEDRYQDDTLIRPVRALAKKKLRRARRELNRAQQESERKEKELGIAETDETDTDAPGT